ncbi:IS1096 element passenger TnpR family protein [Rhodocyclus tenuis]|uniref:IS1096 element passenger TnpR family protein n=1 Tax=Rhodocyclus tenuis TaxID=1066 RepID=UPI0023EE9485|nr:hypothetical protein [Rhodocyclus tenuis]
MGFCRVLETRRTLTARMGWLNCHLHEFEIAGERYGIPDREFNFGQEMLDNYTKSANFNGWK